MSGSRLVCIAGCASGAAPALAQDATPKGDAPAEEVSEVEVTGIRRRGMRSQHPEPQWRFEMGDAIVLLGRPEELALARIPDVQGLGGSSGGRMLT